MSFRNLDNKAAYTVDGIPYLWNSGDVTTLPSNETISVGFTTTTVQYYGTSTAIGSGRIVIGSPSDNNGEGSAYIYDLNLNLIQKIFAVGGRDLFDFFGSSVSVNNGIVVVGSPYDETSGLNAGSIYIYDLNGQIVDYIQASNAANNDYFGTSVSVGNGRIVVGSPGKNSSTGSVYIFDKSSGAELKILNASNAAAGDDYGWSVAVGCGRIIVGAPDKNNSQGSVYLYDLYGNEIKIITPFDPSNGDRFGYRVSVGSGRIVVGVYADSIGANISQGSCYIYDLDGNLIKKITASDGGFDHRFGISVSVGSGRIVVGANNSDFNGSSSGSAYVFDLDGNQLAKILPGTSANTGDYFGNDIAVGSGKIVIGAIGDDNANGSDAGAVYIYDTPQVYNLYDALDLNIRLA